MVTKAQAKAVKKYQTAHYDQMTIRVEKGIRARIEAIMTGSLNEYINSAILQKLEADERKKDLPDKLPDNLFDLIDEDNPFADL